MSIDEKSVRFEKNGRVLFTFSQNVFSVEAVKAAAYRFADLGGFSIDMNDGKIVVELNCKDPSNTNAQETANAFCNEVIDQDLRIQIRKETEASRNLILAQAFSRTNLL